MNKEEIIDLCNKEVNKLTLILHEKKIDTGLVAIELITPLISRYISLAYDCGNLNNNKSIH